MSTTPFTDTLEALTDEDIKKLTPEEKDFLIYESEKELGVAYDVPQLPEAEPMGALGTAATTALDTLALGYGPQIVGKAKELFGADYTTARDKAAATLKASQEENPIASGIGTGAGILGSMLLPGLAGARVIRGGGAILGSGGAKAAARTGAALTEAGATSFLQNPGDIPGKTDPLQLEERKANLVETITSPMTIGLSALAGAAPRFTKSKTPEALNKNEANFLSLLEPTPSDFQDILSKGPKSAQSAKEIAKFMKNNRIGMMGDDYEQIYTKANQKRKQLANEIQEIYIQNNDKIDKAVKDFVSKSGNKDWVRKNPEIVRAITNFGSEEFYSNLSREFKKNYRFSPDVKKASNELDSYLEILKETTSQIDPRTGMAVIKRPNLLELHEIRKSIDSKINEFLAARQAGAVTQESSAADKAYNFLRDKVNQAIDDELTTLEKITGQRWVQGLKI